MRAESPARLTDAVLLLLRDRVGLVFSESRRAEAEKAISRGAARSGTSDPEGYLRVLSDDAAELDLLIADCTVGETYFFREPDQLEFVRREVIPDITLRRPSGVIRAWSAGCASGEEAYTLAMMLKESVVGARSTVIGTDVARDRLARARRGHYSAWSLRGTPDEVKRRYFTRQGNHYALSPRIRDAVEFRYLNLALEGYPSSPSGIGSMDLILCRNVLIYLNEDAIAAVARRLLGALAPGGWLLLGASDPPLGRLVDCDSVMTGAGLAYRSVADGLPRLRRPEARVRGGTFHLPGERRQTPTPPPRADGAGLGATDRTASPRPGACQAIEEVRRLVDAGRLTEAGRMCALALDRHRDSVELLYLHSVLLSGAGHLAEAADASRRALYLDSGMAVAHLGLGDALARMGEVGGAIRSLGNALRSMSHLDPSDPVPASGGETAARLSAMVRARLRLLEDIA